MSATAADEPVLLRVEGLEKQFAVGARTLFEKPRTVKAVGGVSFELKEGETLGLVGESGSGKSTTGRLILRLVPHSAGSVHYKGTNIFELSAEAFKPYRRDMQMIFQDPASSLNPAYSVKDVIAEPMIVHGVPPTRKERDERVLELLEQVGLDRAQAGRFPHEFSGGQKQRIGIARALAVNARLIVADEPVSALDVSIQSQILNLLQDLKHRYGLSYLFIAHDLAVVKHMSQRVAVMYLGRIVELATSEELYRRPAHPYTQMLLDAIPKPRVDMTQRHAVTVGAASEIPSPINPPSGCAFHTRCPYKKPICESETPAYREISPGHHAACHFV
jgi:oligopeptide transport system ATP-binding protein